MRCTPVEKLLPLYVEGDLDASEASAVGAHLSSCEDCRRLAKELQVSQERLRNFAAPEFDEEFYRSIRSAVLTEINSRPRPQTSFLNIFTAPFTMRPALAASILLFILLGGLSVLLIKRLSTGESADARMAAIEKSLREINPVEYYESSQGAGVSALTDGPGKERVRQSDAAFAGITRSGSRSRKRVEVEPTQRVIPQRNDSASTTQAAQAPTRNENEKRDVTPTREAIARMEIQTSDPNIRIIWLARKPSE